MCGEGQTYSLGIMDYSALLGLGWSVASMLWQPVLRWHKTQAEGEGIRHIFRIFVLTFALKTVLNIASRKSCMVGCSAITGKK